MAMAGAERQATRRGAFSVLRAAAGAFLVTAASGSSDPRLLIFTGPDFVERRTNVRVPGADLLISLITNGFDLRAFDEMFRAPQLHRWTNTPPLVIEARTLQFT